jgi:2-methylisocitrate lyase-like PEP mutase family enzyme
LNLEDFQNGKLVDLAAQIEKIRAVRRVGERLGTRIVINARTDIFLAQLGDAATRFERSVERLLAYRDAGADCLFVPGVYDQETIAALVRALQFPLNILATGGVPTVERLQQLGVARVSLGSGPMRATMGLMRRIAAELRDSGTYTRMLEAPVTYPDANELMQNVAWVHGLRDSERS